MNRWPAPGRVFGLNQDTLWPYIPVINIALAKLRRMTHPCTTIIEVALPSPLRRLFDYGSTQAEPPVVGARVKVPFGRRELIGVVVGHKLHTDIPADKLRLCSAVLDPQPVITESLLKLCKWTARYYQYSLGEALSQALPALLRKGEDAAYRRHRCWLLPGPLTDEQKKQLRRSPRQLEVLFLLAEHPQGLSQAMLASLGFKTPLLNMLVEKGFVQTLEKEPVAPRFDQCEPALRESSLTLNPEQQITVDAVTASFNKFQPFLLEGVTGSGKTEVYLQLIERVLSRGQQALVLVPEIGLAPQTLERFKRRFNVPISLLHSGRNDRERLDGWLQAGRGESGIVIGTRSAIFTPLVQPGLIIIDEEHDNSYKQQDGLRYSARDLAVFRAQQEGIPVLLGSATPSLETLHNCLQGRYTHLHLRQRAGGATPPRLELLDIRSEAMRDGLSQSLLAKMDQHLRLGQQVLVFLNRRGYAPSLVCNHCGWLADCPHCDAHMTLHRSPFHLHCHHCDHQTAVPVVCPNCQHQQLTPVGQGTERSEELIARLFPRVPVVRIDRDTTRRREAMEKLLEPVHRGDPCILVGTQMLAKGHHFPNVTLVAILNADSGLFSADFRGLEKTGQLILQVAGRAGREGRSGEVIIQTANPDHDALQLLVGKGYPDFARQQLSERQHLCLPPFRFLALLRAEAAQLELAESLLLQARDHLSQWLQHHELNGGVQPVGPLPAQMEKRQGRYRVLLMIQSSSRKLLGAALADLTLWLEGAPEGRKVRWSVDMDAQEMQ